MRITWDWEPQNLKELKGDSNIYPRKVDNLSIFSPYCIIDISSKKYVVFNPFVSLPRRGLALVNNYPAYQYLVFVWADWELISFSGSVGRWFPDDFPVSAENADMKPVRGMRGHLEKPLRP